MTPDGLVFEDCRPPKPFRTIAHHVVELFKGRLNDATEVGFHCHCGHKGGVQFTEYQAMTALPSTVPDNICDLVIAAWRAHTKDLDDVHPNAEDQIRDFFSRQLEQPGGPTMNDAPRYPLTAIPPGTPKPKSLTISAFVDEGMRRIIVDYAEKLGIPVEPVESRHFDWLVTDRPTGLKSVTATAMREYLARLLYGDEGLVENLLADEKGDNSWRQMPIPSKEMREAWEKWDCLFTEPHGKRCSLLTHIFRGNLQNFSGWGEPDRFEEFDETKFNTSPNIFWRPSGKTWAEVEEKVKNTTPVAAAPITKIPEGTHPPSHITIVESGTRPKWGSIEVLRALAGALNIPCGYLGQIDQTFVGNHPWVVTENPCSADFLCGAKVATAAAMNAFLHTERDRAWAKKQEEAGQPPLKPDGDRPTRIILRSYAADDKPRIERLLGLARQLQIPVQLAGPWSCTAFPPGAEDYLALDVVFPEVLVHPRDVLIISEGHEYHDGNGEKRLFSPSLAEAENQLLWAAREDDQRFVTGLVELLGLPAEASRADIAAAVEAKDDDSEIGVITSHQLAECHRQRARYEECDAQVREILGASQGEESVEAAKRVMADLVEWKRELANWKNDATAQRQENAENLRKLLADINEALGIHSEQSLASVLQRAKWLVEQNKYQTEKLAEILGCKSNDFSALLEKVQRVIREHQTLLGERIESNAKIDQLCASLSRERDRLCRHAESAQNNNAVEQLNAIHVRILHILGPDASTAGIFDSVEKVVKERDNLGEKLDTVHRDLAKRLGLPKDAGWNAIMIAVERIVGDSRNPVEIRANNKELGVKLAREYDRNLHLRAALDTAEKDRDALKERLETAVTAERQTVAQRIDLALTGSANCTDLERMLQAAERVKSALSDAEAARRKLIAVLSLNEAAGWGTIASFVAGKRDGLKDCIRRLSLHQSLIGLVADALDAPNEEKDPDDDGDLNTALVDRLTGYYRRLYTAAGFAEPPQGGWAQLLAEFERPRES